MNVVVVIFGAIFGLILFGVIIFLGWVLPITLGVKCAKRKNYSPAWMCFGIHPIGGWIAFIVLSCLEPRVACAHCGGFIKVNFRICPYCHAELAKPVNSARPTTSETIQLNKIS